MTDTTIGTVVKAVRYQAGQPQGARRGVILGEALGGWLVWFYGAGAPEPGATVAVAFPREITTLCTVGELSDSTIRRLLSGVRRFEDGRALGYALDRILRRRRAGRCA